MPTAGSGRLEALYEFEMALNKLLPFLGEEGAREMSDIKGRVQELMESAEEGEEDSASLGFSPDF